MITSAPARPESGPPASLTVVETGPRAGRDLAVLTGIAAAVVVVALVLARSTGMWLDEAQTVAISRLPVGDLLDALRHDGSPPLYYLLLHGWIRLFGTGDTAVRALSAVFAVATVPAAVTAARRTLGGSATTTTRLAGAVLLTAPFFSRYATEGRMYSLVFLLVALGWLAAERVWRDPRPGPARLAAFGLVGGLLALTHYWALFLIVPAAAVLAARRRWRMLAALAAGGLLFAPWLPSFAYQLAHTGAPWGAPANSDVYEFTLRGFAGGPGRLGALGLVYFALVLVGVFGRAVGDAVHLDVRGSALGGRLALAVLAPLTLGLAVSSLSRSAFAVRYAAIVFIPFVVLVVLGLQLVRPAHALRFALAGLLALGVWRSAYEAHAQRTQARRIAAVLNAQAAENDLVVFCPDQLGPAVARLLHTGAATSAYPTGTPGDIIDWVDYRDRNHAATPVPWITDASAGTAGSVWYVTMPGYRTFGSSCGRMFTTLERLRPGGERLVKSTRLSYERASLWRFPHQ